MNPKVSVVIVNDYAAGESVSQEFTRKTFSALANQTFKEPVEFIYAETKNIVNSIPEELLKILPDLKIITASRSHSYHLKNEGIKSAKGDIVAVIDLDCTPDKNWLYRLVNVLRQNPKISIVTGKTVYEGKNLLIRILSLLERCYVDPGKRGETVFVENSNAGYRRSTLLECKFPDEFEIFTSGVCYFRNLQEAGYKILYEPQMLVTHHFPGWEFEKDFRRNCGYAYYTSRKINPNIRFSGFSKPGYFSIPLFFVALIVLDWFRCIRLGLRWNLKIYEIPVAMFIAVLVRFLEIPGFIDGIKQRAISGTNYR